MEKPKLNKLAEFTKAQRGRLSALARELGVPPSYLSQMISGHRPMQPEYCPVVERFTRGAVTRYDCRPLDGDRIWPRRRASQVVPSKEAA